MAGHQEESQSLADKTHRHSDQSLTDKTLRHSDEKIKGHISLTIYLKIM
jgi:hypothetical protein